MFLCDLILIFNLTILIQIITMAGTEVGFFLVHRALHRNWPELHKFHHCCKYSSFTTNLLFHPVDMALEFIFPIAVIAILNILLWNNPMTLLCFSVFSTWYASDHCEYVRSPHWYHHKYIDTTYTIYLPGSSHDPHDKVRKIIKSIRHESPNKS
eukprot:TRINITY_DN2595_c0_g1_i1.p1 TRINITY_DN2595_c0_g1~~TRINITY_DN2595_c0_g1_i1.p1  ORF type:complete len:154 (+),score=2.38 TRINITY_DN2595_c0_g1_i1:267-728(+)